MCVGGVDFLVLVDSGADRSVIRKKLWMTITKGGCELTEYSGNESAANGRGGIFCPSTGQIRREFFA